MLLMVLGLITVINIINLNGKEVYERRADDIFSEIIGDVHEVARAINARKKTMRYYGYTLPANLSDLNNDYENIDITTPKTTKPSVKSTTEKIPQVTPVFTPEEIKDMKTEEEYMRSRTIKLKIKNLIDEDFKPPIDFERMDNMEHDTRRFETLIDFTRTRRERYDTNDLTSNRMPHHFREKKQLVELMKQFIYITRYTLPYVQLMRKRHLSQYRYRIGFCFALLRELKNQQNLIYSAWRPNIRMYFIMYISLRMYEKIVRLDIDIKDVIKLIANLNYYRIEKEEPHFYKPFDFRRYNVKESVLNSSTDKLLKLPNTFHLQDGRTLKSGYDPKRPPEFRESKVKEPVFTLSSEEILKLPSMFPLQNGRTPRPGYDPKRPPQFRGSKVKEPVLKTNTEEILKLPNTTNLQKARAPRSGYEPKTPRQFRRFNAKESVLKTNTEEILKLPNTTNLQKARAPRSGYDPKRPLQFRGSKVKESVFKTDTEEILKLPNTTNLQKARAPRSGYDPKTPPQFRRFNAKEPVLRSSRKETFALTNTFHAQNRRTSRPLNEYYRNFTVPGPSLPKAQLKQSKTVLWKPGNRLNDKFAPLPSY